MTTTEVADIVVVGFGGAGAAAAITAHDHGASVLVLEKAEDGGGSTGVSGGNIRLINDTGGAVEHFSALVGAGTPRESVEAYVAGLGELIGWLAECGAELVPHDQYSDQALAVVRPGSAFPDVPHAEALGSRVQVARAPGVTGGEAIWEVLSRNVIKRDIPVRYHARVERLCWNDSHDRIVGVEVRNGRSTRRVEARRGVVLACGGFNYGHDVHRDLFGTELPAYSRPDRNTGDGIRLAQDVGASIWHLTAIAARFGYKFPEYEAGFTCQPPAQGLFVTDQDGRRYFDEAGVDMHAAGRCMLERDTKTGRLRRIPSYLIFDETTRLAGPICVITSGNNRGFEWSEDNSAEVERGWIQRAGTLAELATKLGIPPANLERTAAVYNETAVAGGDEFGRRPEFMEPLAPPFYGVALYPVLLNTQGGPRRNARAEILDVRGRPIPGLYGAGELGSMWGPLYPGAGNLSEALITGRNAVRSALG
ncbi:FAD-binding protein [Actinophytocola sp.]|uniref:FAD-binding protein n=1 Tax=Actinophytocola sp. TaxID=1872138 RepID=UPI003D6A772F